MNHSQQSLLLTAILLGWVAFSFSLFNLGPFSLTLLLLSSCALAARGFRFNTLFTVSTLCILASGVIAWVVAVAHGADDNMKTHTHLLQHLLAVGVLIGAQSLDWNRLLPRFRRTFLWLSGITLAYAIYQYVARMHSLPFAFLPVTNLQISTDQGLQRGASLGLVATGGFARVSSFFAEPSDLGRFMLWCVAVGCGWIRDWIGLALIGVGIAGILVSQSMGGIVGLCLLLPTLLFLKRDFQSSLLIFLLGSMLLPSFVYVFPDAFNTVFTRAELIATERESRLLKRARFAYLEENTEIFLEAPLLGHGLASIRTVAEDNVVGNAFMLLLIERGIVGTALFCMPFVFIAFKLAISQRFPEPIYCMAFGILFVEFYCLSTFGQIYFQPIYVAFGFAAYVQSRVPARTPSFPTPTSHLRRNTRFPTTNARHPRVQSRIADENRCLTHSKDIRSKQRTLPSAQQQEDTNRRRTSFS